jgi:predicted amidohydrolase YtcJ
MIRQDRRAFLRSAGSGVAALALSGPALARMMAGPAADLIVHNARIYTLDPAMPLASGFAVKAGRFTAIGDGDDVKGLASAGTEVIDARGMTIVPGFIDTHNHPIGTTLLYEVIVGNPFEVEIVTIDSIVAKLKAKAAKTAPGYWVEGFFFDDTKVRDRRPLTVQELDRVSTQHPVMVLHRGGHTAYFNSAALALGNITRATPDPRGGTYDKLPNGELSGRVTDNAMFALRALGKHETFSAAETRDRERNGMAYISSQFARYGLTGVHQSGGPDLEAIEEVRARGELRHRVSFELNGKTLDAMIEQGVRTGFGDEWIRIGATFEHLADGSFSERTMAMSRPYPGTNYSGNLTEPQDDLDAWAERAQRAGIQPNFHANGDVAIAAVLNAYERAQRVVPRKDVRPKITHCTLINPDLVRRIKALDAIPQLFTTYAYYNSDKFAFYGEDIMRNAMAYRSFLDAGVMVAAGSDFFPGPFAPLMGIQGMVSRTGWDGTTWGANQRITVDEALRVNSLHGAYASHEEAIKGSISPGKLADYVVLADDPHRIDPSRIKDIAIAQTVCGGTTTYKA